MSGRGSYARQKMLLDLIAVERCVPSGITVPAHFEVQIDRSTPWACWPWLGSSSGEGYGLVRVQVGGASVAVGAHRVAYHLATGFWHWGRYGPVIRHLCHNPPCCNPKHLLAGSRSDNVWDDQMRKAGVDLVAIRRNIELGLFASVMEAV